MADEDLTKGMIGKDLRRRSIIEVDARMIDVAGLRDRLDADADLATLIASIRNYGQHVPVLLRPNPNDPERYQVVFGRRRVAALQALDQPIKAMIRDLDDQALVLAQGQENAARKDLTFIEKANFARQMRDAGYDRKIICDALAMDKTLISRILSVADRVPVRLIEAIGSAPNIGRDRWLSLADKIGNRDLVEQAQGDSSDARFEAVMQAMRAPKRPPAQSQQIKTSDGKPMADVARKAGNTVLTLPKKTIAGFDDWLIKNLPALYRTWKNQSGTTEQGE